MLRRLAGRVDDRADRSAHGDTVAVPTAATIHRASIEARAAADAIERAAEISAAEQFASPIIDEHNVQFGARLWSVEVRCVRCDRLTGCRTGKQPQENAEIFESRN